MYRIGGGGAGGAPAAGGASRGGAEQRKSAISEEQEQMDTAPCSRYSAWQLRPPRPLMYVDQGWRGFGVCC
jgi:hypothetical protein